MLEYDTNTTASTTGPQDPQYDSEYDTMKHDFTFDLSSSDWHVSVSCAAGTTTIVIPRESRVEAAAGISESMTVDDAMASGLIEPLLTDHEARFHPRHRDELN